MNQTTEQLIDSALRNLNSSQGDTRSGEFANRLTQLSIAYSLIAIAQELHKMIERDEWLQDRKERIQEHKEKSKEIW